MNPSNLTTRVPEPPHDPTFWLLDARAGWQQADLDHVEITPGDRSLALTPLPGSGRSLSEPSGSFGALTTPANVALGPDGSIFLLDQQQALLKRFDPCACKFEVAACLGGVGTGPRQLSNPHGIGICGGNLFVCDTENHRLSIFALRAFVLRAHWSPPPTAGLTNAWKPFAVAFDGRGRVFVTDSANGCIHRFHPSGIWEKCLTGFGHVTHLAIDCRNHLYVVEEGTPDAVRVVDDEGRDLDLASRIEDLVSLFPLPCFPVDAAGNLYLANLCTSSGAASDGVFDLAGNATRATSVRGNLYGSQGSYLSRPLDSKFYRCQWHRIVLRGRVPAGSRVLVETYTAEAEVSVVQIQNLPNESWETQQTVKQIAGGEWDCLVRSGAGRFLWLRLKFTSKGAVTPVIESIRVEFPRISPRRFLPAVFGAEPTSADFTDRFLSVFDTILRSIEQQVDQQARLFDPRSAPSQSDGPRPDFLTWLSTWIGVTLDRHWPEPKRRKLLRQAARLYDLRGTREGLWRQLLLLLDMDWEHLCCADDQPRTRCQPAPRNCEPIEKKPCRWQPPPLILEHFHLRRWLFLGTGRLGDQAVLWGKRIVNRSQLDDGARVDHTQLLTIQDPYRDPFHYYAHKFTVFVPAGIEKSARKRKALENLLQAERPAHTLSQVEFVGPRFRIGVQSMIGFDSVIGRYPEGVTLNQSALGRASVLTAPPYKQGGPSLEIGDQSRIGTTTKLE
jgi:phage tail-like protein